MQKPHSPREGERGSAGTKFTVFVVGLLLVLHAGYNYVPVAYDAEALKTEMQTAVVQALAMPGKMNPVDNVKARIQKAIAINNIPMDALIDVRQNGATLTAHVTFTKQINILPFGLYKYDYRFDHTATPTGFLLKDAQ